MKKAYHGQTYLGNATMENTVYTSDVEGWVMPCRRETGGTYFILALLKTLWPGTALVAQWIRLCAPNAGGLGLIPGQRTRSYLLQLRAPMPQLKIPHASTMTLCSQIKIKSCDQALSCPQSKLTLYLEHSLEGAPCVALNVLMGGQSAPPPTPSYSLVKLWYRGCPRPRKKKELKWKKLVCWQASKPQATEMGSAAMETLKPVSLPCPLAGKGFHSMVMSMKGSGFLPPGPETQLGWDSGEPSRCPVLARCGGRGECRCLGTSWGSPALISEKKKKK